MTSLPLPKTTWEQGERAVAASRTAAASVEYSSMGLMRCSDHWTRQTAPTAVSLSP